MQQVASFRLGQSAEMRLSTDSNISQVEVLYGDELQEFVGTANTLFVVDDAGHIVLDTVHLEGGLTPQYIVRTYDRSSTYGAEVWYIVYPLMPRMEGDGPWCVAKVPWDLPGLVDIDSNGNPYLVYYDGSSRENYTVYAFECGIFREIPSLSTVR